jgi:hypothetical protein
MNYLKVLGVSIIVAAALMTPAAASATVLTSPAGVEYTGSFSASLNGSMLLKAGFAEITCTTSTFSGSVNVNVSFSEGSVGTWGFSTCGSSTVDTLKTWRFEILSGGTMKVAGYQITVAVTGVSCVYGTAAATTTIGKISGGSPANIKMEGKLPLLSGGFFCASQAPFTASYTVTSPTTLLVD